MSDLVHLDIPEGYDRWAEIYDDELNPLVMLEQPVVRGWFNDPAGLHVADVGCGTGRHTAWLAKAGARVTAFDASPGMISKARSKPDCQGVRFHLHMLPDTLPVPDNAFDLALLTLVADHIADLSAAFLELRRILKPAGWLVFTVLHPAMNLLGITARFTDPDSGSEVRVAAHRHTCADYVMAALRSGFVIDEMLERSADPALAAVAPRAEKYVGWPLLMAMKLRKREWTPSCDEDGP